MRTRFDRTGVLPATVIVIRIGEVYLQCARALIRAGPWCRDAAADRPTPGEILAEVSDGGERGGQYDAERNARAEQAMR